ncbi:Nuclear transcription factor Y subunit C-3 [Linum perenne]
MRQPGTYSKLLSGGLTGRTGPHSLPLARIKKIMKKSGDDVKMISGEAPIVFSKACELFIEELTRRSWMVTVQGKRRTLHKEDVASAVAATDVFDFLVGLVDNANNNVNGGSGSATNSSSVNNVGEEEEGEEGNPAV